MRYLLMGIMCAVLLGCQSASLEARPELIEWLSDLTQAKVLAQQESKPIMIDFYTTWCGWCGKLDTDTYSDIRVAQEAKNFVCVKIDGDKQEALIREFGVRGYPTIAFLKPDGSLIGAYPGYQPPAQFLELLRDIKTKAGQ